ncbi:methionyl-tRNA formyltransferase [Desulfotalea psychrophila]|uniref:Methionyl-tRNA formyltransferase n=1 Tax=Desulfotalea psychrophila (strain LSv54 / DSM 12343) TaxID=177439 RepID=FMT_DESPS|nr:methionyl-tRNA formyltransferase [Desulfotalea psychrophila]Q6AQ97.1 RecName: Full=Methionyl-tRNA formyltransferase [Desulfotalea psychrophila LSv54]CAG35476.1 probable methionyl-tRNA formyltransferase [Desulfotalea psychrophila LSv54]
MVSSQIESEEKSLRIIFMGTPDFASSNLRALLAGPDQVVAVVTQPDRPKGRGKKLTSPPVKVIAEEAGLPVLQPTKVRTDEFLEALAAYAPDLIVVTAYGRILPKPILDLAPLGCINVHGSLLPKYRGAAPIQWAVIQGDDEVGVTTMQMDEGMDTGDILLRKIIIPSPDETAGTLFDKLAELGTSALLETIEGLKKGTIRAEAQDHAQATEAPMLSKNDGLIDWSRTATELESLIRGMDPWPSAFCFLEGKRLRLFMPEVSYQKTDAQPGAVLRAGRDGLLIATGKNCLLVKEIQPEGKKRMTVEAFLCGAKIGAETVLKTT